MTTEDAADQRDSSIRNAKRELRQLVRNQRQQRGAPELANADSQMAEHLIDVIGELPRGDVAVYIAMPGEPPTDSLRTALKDRGYRPLIPKVDASELMWAVDSESTEWEMNSFGTQEPVNNFIENQENVLRDCVAIVIPAHSIDHHGFRLGQGKGFYDRALEFTRTTASTPLLISLTFESEYIDSVPHESHDIPVDISVTESQVRWFNSPD